MTGITALASALYEYAETSSATATSVHGASMNGLPRQERGAKPME